MSTTVKFTCPNCGYRHEYRDEEIAAKVSLRELRERAFHKFGDKLDLAHDHQGLRGEVDGRPWITNGHIATTPERVLPGRECEPLSSGSCEYIANLMRVGATGVLLTPGPVGVEVSFLDNFPIRRLDGGDAPVYVAERYFAVLKDCDVWRGRGALDPVRVYSKGVLQGIVMPMKMDARDFKETQK